MIDNVGTLLYALVLRNGEVHTPTLVSLSQQTAFDRGTSIVDQLNDGWSFEVVPVPLVGYSMARQELPPGPLECDT